MLHYQIHWKDNKSGGVAHNRTREVRPFFVPPGILHLPTGTIEGWKTLNFDLRDGGFEDYQANDIGCRLCSESMKTILDRNARPSCPLQWLQTVVKSGTEKRTYWLLHFPNPPDVLDPKSTIYAGKVVVKPVVSCERVTYLTVYTYPDSGNLTIFVSAEVRAELLQAKCTGMESSKAAIR